MLGTLSDSLLSGSPGQSRFRLGAATPQSRPRQEAAQIRTGILPAGLAPVNVLGKFITRSANSSIYQVQTEFGISIRKSFVTLMEK